MHSFNGPYTRSAVGRVLKQMSSRSGVYLMVSKDCTSWIYVGSTVNLAHRLSEHHHLLKKNKHPRQVIQDYYNSGHEAMYFIMPCEDREHAYVEEQRCLDILRNHSGLVNVAVDAKAAWIRGDNYVNPLTGRARSQETIKKISLHAAKRAAEGHNSMRGKTHSDETKKKIAEKARNRIVTDETREKLRHRWSRTTHPRSRPVVIEGVEYDSVISAAAALNMSYGMVHWRVNNDSPEFNSWAYKTQLKKES